MTDKGVLIIGAGQAGAQTATSLRQGGFEGAITIVGDESALPYQRPTSVEGLPKRRNGTRTALFQIC